MGQSKWLAAPYCAILGLHLGCTGSTSDLEVAGVARDAATAARLSEQQAQEFDFGVMLSSGQTLKHVFSLSNPTNHPIQLVKAVTFTPCCAAIGPLPGLIPPGKAVHVPVELWTENKEGGLRATFAVEVDSAAIPVWRLAVSVRLVPEWGLERKGEAVDSLSIGQTGKLSYRIFCRRKEGDGRALPDRIVASGPIKVTCGASTDDPHGFGGIMEATRDIEVEILPSSQPGRRRGEIVFNWADGQARNHVVAWEVRPWVRVAPSGLVIRSSKEPVAVTLTVAADDRPIRIIEVDGPLAKPFEPSGEAKRVQPLELEVNTSKFVRGGLADIRIATDHPDQPSVSAAVLITTPEQGEGR